MENRDQTRRGFMNGIGKVAFSGAFASLASCATEYGNIGLGPGLVPTLLLKPDTLMRKFAPHFPVNRDYRGLLDMKFSDPVLSMVPEQEKVRVGLTTLGSLGGLIGGNQSLGGRCQLACGLRYEPQSRQIFLKDAVLENFSLAGVPNQWTGGLRDVVNLLGQNYLEKIPVYQLGTGGGLGFMKTMRVTEEGIRLTFGL